MRAAEAHRAATDPAWLMEAAGLDPDPWQAEMLGYAAHTPGARVLLMTSRQAGKSTTMAALAVWWACMRPAHPVVIVAPTQRQATELIQRARALIQAAGLPVRRDAATQIVMPSGGRMVALAGRGQVRGMTAGLLLVDEGAWLPDEVYTGGLRPMLSAVPGGGCMVAASTPAGPRGWFYGAWTVPGRSERWRIPWDQVPRISSEYAAEYRASVPPHVWASEMQCEFAGSATGIFHASLLAGAMPTQSADDALVIGAMPSAGADADLAVDPTWRAAS